MMITDHMSLPAYQDFFLKEYDRWGKYISTAKITLQQ